MLQGANILVTGGSGFIGTNLIRRLQERGADVLNVSLDPPQLQVSTIQEDLTISDFEWLDQGFDYVIHLAALTNKRYCENLSEAYKTNVDVTFRLFEALKGRGVKKIIFPSSVVLYAAGDAALDEETSPLDIYQDNYVFTKGLAEFVAKRLQKDLPILIFRFGNIFGPNQDWKVFPNLIPQTITGAITDKTVEIWNPHPIRDFVFVEDAVDAIIKGLESDYKGTLNVGSGKGTSIGEMGKKITKITDARYTALEKPTWGPTKVICSTERIKDALGWQARTDIDAALAKTIDFYKDVL